MVGNRGPKELEDQIDRRFTRRQEVAQRILWAAIALLLVLVGFGAVGGGIAAEAREEESTLGGEVALEYLRFNRAGHVSTLAVTVFAPDAKGDTLNITFSQEFTQNAHIRSLIPPPDAAAVGPAGAVYSFDVSAWDAPLKIGAEYAPTGSWRWEGVVTVTAGDAEPVPLVMRQTVYP